MKQYLNMVTSDPIGVDGSQNPYMVLCLSNIMDIHLMTYSMAEADA